MPSEGDQTTAARVSQLPPTLAPVSLSCASCGAELSVAADRRTARCPYCDSPSVIHRPAGPDRPDPVFAIGFRIGRKRARAVLRSFLRRKRWAPRALRGAPPGQLEGVYLPAYLYSAVAASRYRTSIGEDYVETVFDPRKKRVRRVRRTEHRTLEGSHRCYVDDVVVTASRGVANNELEAVEPFDLGGLRRFGPALISGWIAEEPTLGRDASRELGRDEARDAVRARLHAFMPGDSHRGLECTTELRDEALDLVLLPLWVCAVRWRPDRPPVRVLVNGQTGAVAGRVPVSWTKVAGVVAIAAALIGVAVLVGVLL